MFAAVSCESCRATRPGGIARGLVIEERDGSDTPWTLWAFGDGWTTTDEVAGSIAVCPQHQSNALVRIIRLVSDDSAREISSDTTLSLADKTL